jgi:amino acid transporter
MVFKFKKNHLEWMNDVKKSPIKYQILLWVSFFLCFTCGDLIVYYTSLFILIIFDKRIEKSMKTPYNMMFYFLEVPLMIIIFMIFLVIFFFKLNCSMVSVDDQDSTDKYD